MAQNLLTILCSNWTVILRESIVEKVFCSFVRVPAVRALPVVEVCYLKVAVVHLVVSDSLDTHRKN